MSDLFPSWLKSLNPSWEPQLERLSRYSAQLAWHVDIQLCASFVPPDGVLTGSETWNGKALVVGASPTPERSVGEVEVTQRLRSAFPRSQVYWTAGRGNPPQQWREWALTPERRTRAQWLLEFDRDLRAGTDLLQNDRGWPDVLMWHSGPSDLFCVEYKGPSPSSPANMDEISVEQDAWFRAALEQGRLHIDRYAVVRWIPSPEDRAKLLQQARASAAGRLARRRSSAPAPKPRPKPEEFPHARRDSVSAGDRGEQESTAHSMSLKDAPVVGQSVIIFPAGEPGAKGRFLRWREANPKNFAINLRAPRNAMFHLARCHTLGEPWDVPMLNAKVVADTLAELDSLAEARGWKRRDCRYCSRYFPP